MKIFVQWKGNPGDSILSLLRITADRTKVELPNVLQEWGAEWANPLKREGNKIVSIYRDKKVVRRVLVKRGDVLIYDTDSCTFYKDLDYLEQLPI